MSWLIITILSSVVSGTATVFDRLLLFRRGFSEPWTYTFWIGVLGIFAVLLIPFGFTVLPLWTIILALVTGAVFLTALFLMFWALQKGEASGAFTAIGGLAPIFTMLFASFLLNRGLGLGNFIGFTILVIGGFILLAVEEREVRLVVFILASGSAFLFGLTNVLRKLVFEASPFITGFVWISLGGFLFSLISLLWPKLRRRIFVSFRESNSYGRLLFFANRAWAALGSALVHYATFLGHPALVDAVQGFKFVVIFIGAWLLLEERFSGKILRLKIFAILLIVFGIVWLGTVQYAKSLPLDNNRQIIWGITFSAKFSRALGLDWQKNFEAILQELRPSKLRLIAYWDEIEKERGEFDFSEIDWLLAKAKAYDAQIILVLGLKVPRWPECHVPHWAQNQKSKIKMQNDLEVYMKEVVKRYLDNPSIIIWQVENEPFLLFGKCPGRSKDFLAREITLVKSIDPDRPILVTDGGEFGLWYKAASKGDVFGTTMYRKVFPRFLGSIFGVVEYPLSPSFFRLKEKIVRNFSAVGQKKFIVAELQAEPWGSELLPNLSYEEQKKIFNRDYFLETINFAKETGFDEYYLWGAEWWYWLKEKKNDLDMWDEVNKIIVDPLQ